jgi:hypothetical protein
VLSNEATWTIQVYHPSSPQMKRHENCEATNPVRLSYL